MNEFCGAYGHNFTFEEMQWLAHWLVVRGCNLLVPHAFYYSIRGPRVDERPPDVGPNSTWWPRYKPFAQATSRLCWLNTDCEHVCELAILGLNDYLPWRPAKVCFQHQRDFNYLEARHLWEDARVDGDGVHLAGMHYRVLILEEEPPEKAKTAIDVLAGAGRIIRWEESMSKASLLARIDGLIDTDVRVSPPTPDLRVRHVRKAGTDYYMLFNEGAEDIDFRVELAQSGPRTLLDPTTGGMRALTGGDPIPLAGHALRVLAVG
jgi:hypothetical protein